jgi:hypothetical protein
LDQFEWNMFILPSLRVKIETLGGTIMPSWLKTIWVLAIIVNAMSLLWFLIGATANFQRSLDLVGVLTLLFLWVPSLILVVLSAILLKKRWVPLDSLGYAALCFVILILLSFAVPLFEGVKTQGWLNNNIERDPIKLTSDGKYEYRIELINIDQKNSRERLYVRNLSTGVGMYISVDIIADDLEGISEGADENWAWAIMIPTDVRDQYELSTTEDLRMPKKKFLIDIGASTSKRLK